MATKTNRMKIDKRLSIEQRADGWWIKSGVAGVIDHGPYETKGLAVEDLRGVNRFVKKQRI